MNMKEIAYFSHYGPGGRKCSCCGPAPSFRKKHDRTVKHRAKDSSKREIKEAIREHELEA